MLEKHKKPTGDPTCPPFVKLAKSIQYDIEKRISARTMDDEAEGDDEEGEEDQDQESDDDDDVSQLGGINADPESNENSQPQVPNTTLTLPPRAPTLQHS